MTLLRATHPGTLAASSPCLALDPEARSRSREVLFTAGNTMRSRLGLVLLIDLTRSLSGRRGGDGAAARPRPTHLQLSANPRRTISCNHHVAKPSEGCTYGQQSSGDGLRTEHRPHQRRAARACLRSLTVSAVGGQPRASHQEGNRGAISAAASHESACPECGPVCQPVVRHPPPDNQ